ncbi:MAG: cobalamin-dependent protein [Anaerolineales bacterium]|nr:cobalamin-dependent protein [Anaerolineales bacterium]
MSKGNAQRITSFYQKSFSGDEHPVEQLVAYKERYFEALANMDAITSRQIIQDAMDAAIPPGTIMLEVFCSVMDRFGQLQANQEITLSEIYAIARIGQSTIEQLMVHLPETTHTSGTVVIGTIAGDFHGMGAKIVATFLRMAGFQVHELGVNVPSATFVDMALEKEATVICASTLLLHTMDQIKAIHDILAERKLTNRIKLIVGGAPFNFDSELYKTVCADATAINASDAIEAVSQLMEAIAHD